MFDIVSAFRNDSWCIFVRSIGLNVVCYLWELIFVDGFGSRTAIGVKTFLLFCLSGFFKDFIFLGKKSSIW